MAAPPPDHVLNHLAEVAAHYGLVGVLEALPEPAGGWRGRAGERVRAARLGAWAEGENRLAELLEWAGGEGGYDEVRRACEAFVLTLPDEAELQDALAGLPRLVRARLSTHWLQASLALDEPPAFAEFQVTLRATIHAVMRGRGMDAPPYVPDVAPAALAAAGSEDDDDDNAASSLIERGARYMARSLAAPRPQFAPRLAHEPVPPLAPPGRARAAPAAAPPAAAPERRSYASFTDEEIGYLEEGVRRFEGDRQMWVKILAEYPFKPGRLPRDLSDKYRKSVKRRKVGE